MQTARQQQHRPVRSSFPPSRPAERSLAPQLLPALGQTGQAASQEMNFAATQVSQPPFHASFICLGHEPPELRWICQASAASRAMPTPFPGLHGNTPLGLSLLCISSATGRLGAPWSRRLHGCPFCPTSARSLQQLLYSLSAAVPALAIDHNRHRSSALPGPESSLPASLQGLMAGFVPQQGRRCQEQNK